MNWGGRECNSRLLGKKQWLRQTRTACSHQMSCRDGAAQRYFLVKRCGAAAPQLCSIIPPGSNLAGANRGTVGGSRRGWGKSPPAVVTLTKNRLCGCFERRQQSWTRFRTGLLRLKSGRLRVRFPPG